MKTHTRSGSTANASDGPVIDPAEFQRYHWGWASLGPVHAFEDIYANDWPRALCGAMIIKPDRVLDPARGYEQGTQDGRSVRTPFRFCKRCARTLTKRQSNSR